MGDPWAGLVCVQTRHPHPTPLCLTPHFACGQFNLSLTMGKGELLNSFVQIACVAILITPVASLWLLKSQTPTLLPICRPWRAINESTLLNQKTPHIETIMRSYCIRNLKKLKNVSQKKSAVSHHWMKGSRTRSSGDCFPFCPLSCWVVLCPPLCCLHPISASGREFRRASPDVPDNQMSSRSALSILSKHLLGHWLESS